MDDLIDMKQARSKAPNLSREKGEDYPYGLSISLDKESLKKLGMDTNLPGMGDTFDMEAQVTVARVAKSESNEYASTDVTLQIKKIKLERSETPKSGRAGGIRMK